MDVLGAVAEELRRLEESLWIAETRFDQDYMNRIFADDFFEFGRSGMVYSRQECLNAASKPKIDAVIPLPHFRVNLLDANNALVTYVSEARHEPMRRANRASIWSRTPDGWRLRFHQGTPTS